MKRISLFMENPQAERQNKQSIWFFCGHCCCRKRNEFLLIFPKSGNLVLSLADFCWMKQNKKQAHVVSCIIMYNSDARISVCLCVFFFLAWWIESMLFVYYCQWSIFTRSAGQGMCWNVLDQNKWFIMTMRWKFGYIRRHCMFFLSLFRRRTRACINESIFDVPIFHWFSVYFGWKLNRKKNMHWFIFKTKYT